MATEDDNFDIDIYGDGSGYNTNEPGDQNQDDTDLVLDAPESTSAEPSANTNNAGSNTGSDPNSTNNAPAEPNPSTDPTHSANSGDQTMNQQQKTPQDAQAPHGVKRKDYDDRPSDPDATTALIISDLFWWTTEDEIRGWINSAGAEAELKDVTFSEHKVNGKSKGQVFVEFTTTQAATASKHKIESGEAPGQRGRKHMVTYTNPHQNPFKTLPKDAPMRKDNRNMGGNFNAGGSQSNFGMNMGSGGYRGGRGGYNRGMGGSNYNNRGNFNNMGGFQGGGGPGMMGGFQGGPMGGMQNYGFNNRGGMMGGMRGGPGGMRGRGGGNMGGNNMMGMPNMNPMAGGMAMNPMAGAMNPMMNMGMQGQYYYPQPQISYPAITYPQTTPGWPLYGPTEPFAADEEERSLSNVSSDTITGQGFQGPNPAAFNQGFFNQGSTGGGNDASWNPHGAKRSRQE